MDPSLQEYHRLLQRIRLFKTLSPPQIDQVIRILEPVSVAAGDYLINEGDTAECFYIIESGRFEVIKKESDADAWHRLAVLGPNDTIGEVALLDRERRSASVRALDDAHLFRITIACLEQLSTTERPAEAAVKITLAGEIAKRLRHTNEITVRTLHDQLEEAKARVAMGVIVSYLLVGTCCYVLALRLVTALNQSAAATTTVSVLVLAFFALLTLMAIRRSGFPFSMYGITLDGWQRATRESIIFTLPVLGAIVLGKVLLINLHPDMVGEPCFALNQSLHLSPLEILLDVIAYALFTPIQEFIARGGVQSAFQQFLVGPHRTVAAIVLANLMFSITHIHLSTSIALLVFVPGLFWGWLYSRHKTLLGVCISHFMVGTFAFYVVGFQNLLR
ncbi:MAG: cyclic nucleotide-binding domain-containing protein [Pseudomonadota bacterium]